MSVEGEAQLVTSEPYRIPMETVTSSNLAAYGFDAENQTLAVQFTNGRIHWYVKVPLQTVLEFGAAQSKGRFYAQHIRGKFSSSRMTGPCPRCGQEGFSGDLCTDCGCDTYSIVEKRYESAATQPEV